MPVDGEVTVSVDVANVGERSGDEVVQLCVRDCLASVAQPVKALKGFERITLAPGERRTVHLVLRAASLALRNERMQKVVERGAFELMVGPDSVAVQSVRLEVR